MKNRTLKALAGAVLALACLIPTAKAMNGVDDAQRFYASDYMTRMTQGGTIGTVAVSTSSELMRLYYVGSSSNDAEVLISTGASAAASLIQFQSPAGTPDTSIGGTSYGKVAGNAAGGVFDLSVSTIQTLGALCDAINASTNYRCRLVGGLRGDIASTILPNIAAPAAGVNNLSAAGGWAVPVGTNTIMSMGIIPAAGKRVVLERCTYNSAHTNITVYGIPAVLAGGKDRMGAPITSDYQVYTSSGNLLAVNTVPDSTSNPLTPWVDFATDQGFPIKSPPIGPNNYDGRVVIRSSSSGNAYNLNQGTGQYIQCHWQER